MLAADLWRAALDETGASMEELRTKHIRASLQRLAKRRER